MARAKIESGVIVKKGLIGIRPLLVEWTEVVRHFCQAEQANPWWFNERATLSTLAGAAWRIKWCALEEYSTAKRGEIPDDPKTKRKPQKGRCDLYVSNKNNSYAFEAKQAWQGISQESNYKTYTEAMKLAFADTGKLHANEANRRIAMVFTVPYFRYSGNSPSAQFTLSKIQPLIDHLKEQDFDAISWVFSNDCKNNRNTKKKLAFPGVFVAMKCRKRGS